MAITIVGTAQSGSASDGGDVTLTFDGTPAENDVVIAVGGCGSSTIAAGQNAGTSSSGYTTIYSDYADDTHDVWCGYKVLGATPDSTFVGTGGNGFEATAYASMVLRGVDTTTPMDATRTVNAGPATDGGPFDGPSITTVTNGAWVITFGYDGDGVISSVTAPSGYSNHAWAHGVDTARTTCSISSKEVTTAGAEDPGAHTDTGSTSNRVEVTIAVRPSGGGGGGATPKGVFGLSLDGPLRRVVYP